MNEKSKRALYDAFRREQKKMAEKQIMLIKAYRIIKSRTSSHKF